MAGVAEMLRPVIAKALVKDIGAVVAYSSIPDDGHNTNVIEFGYGWIVPLIWQELWF